MAKEKDTKTVKPEVKEKEVISTVEEGAKENTIAEETKTVVEEKKESETVAEKKAPGRRGRRPKAESEKEKAAPAKAPAKRGRKPAAEKAEKVEKTAEVKTTAKASDASVVLQLSSGEYRIAELIEQCKAAYLAENKAKIKNIDVYVKPADQKAYYVVNDKVAGSIDL
jgi:hypothetical protein